MSWLPILLLSAVFYGAYNFCIKLSAGHIHQILGAVILQVVAAVIGGVTLLFLMAKKTPFPMDAKGLWFAVLAGVFVGLAEITTFYGFAKGVPASTGIAIIVGGTVVTGMVLGFVVLREQMGWMQIGGIAAILVGIVMLSMSGRGV